MYLLWGKSKTEAGGTIVDDDDSLCTVPGIVILLVHDLRLEVLVPIEIYTLDWLKILYSKEDYNR